MFDFFVIIKRDFISFFGVVLLGLLDYDLIYVIIWFKNKRLLFKIIKIRNYKRMDVEKFKYDFECILFYIVFIFEEFDD